MIGELTINPAVPSHRSFSDPPIKELREGAVFVYPTDTVWGIGCCIDRPDSIQRVFQVKDRPSNRTVPVLLHCSDLADLGKVRSVEKQAIERFWPGSLTLILPAREPESLDVHLVHQGNLALREPGHIPLRRLLQKIGPIVGTSANRTGRPPATERDEIDPELLGAVDWVIGEGASGGTSSTVAQWNPEDGSWTIHRPGPITPAQLARCR